MINEYIDDAKFLGGKNSSTLNGMTCNKSSNLALNDKLPESICVILLLTSSVLFLSTRWLLGDVLQFFSAGSSRNSDYVSKFPLKFYNDFL